MFFSIIVPVYNAETTLRRCVDSILLQESQDFELLLINDGSTDSSAVICDAYQALDERIHVFHKSNGGVSSARNVGLNNATGEWFVFVDADDYVGPEWLSVFADNIDAFGENVLISQRANIFWGEKLEEVLHAKDAGRINKDTFFSWGQYGYLWNKCFNKQIIKDANISFDNTMQCFEDEIFVLEYSQYVECMVIPSHFPTYFYFLPDFENKYRRECTFERQYSRYSKTKKLSHAASVILVDWMVMQMFKECSSDFSKVKLYALMLKESVGTDVKYALGLKKCLFRSARYIPVKGWWIFLVWIYSVMYKLKSV